MRAAERSPGMGPKIVRPIVPISELLDLVVGCAKAQYPWVWLVNRKRQIRSLIALSRWIQKRILWHSLGLQSRLLSISPYVCNRRPVQNVVRGGQLVREYKVVDFHTAVEGHIQVGRSSATRASFS